MPVLYCNLSDTGKRHSEGPKAVLHSTELQLQSCTGGKQIPLKIKILQLTGSIASLAGKVFHYH